MRDWVNKEQDLPNLYPKNVIIGFVEDNFGGVVKNLLLLLYKWYIYNNRISKSPLGFDGFNMFVKICTISFERPVYLCDAWHVFPPKYEAWTHFNRP